MTTATRRSRPSFLLVAIAILAPVLVADRAEALQAPALVSPVHVDASRHGYFRWQPVTGAVAYRLQVTIDPDLAFASPIARVTVPHPIVTSSVNTTLTHGVSYRWRVAAVDADSQASWSPAARFRASSSVPLVVEGVGAGHVAAIGCSNTRETVQGYIAAGGHRFGRRAPASLPGGTVVTWAQEIAAPDSPRWREFSANLRVSPTRIVWWQLCIRQEETDEASYQAALTVLAELQRRNPASVVFVSALNGYVEPHYCSIAGPDGPSRAAALADRLASEGRARRAADLGALLSIYPENASEGATPQNNQTVSDGCHPNDAGESFLGQNLLTFLRAA